MSPRYVVRPVRFGPFPWVVIDSTRDVIVKACPTAIEAADYADELEVSNAPAS